MPIFKYEAMDSIGKSVSGDISAATSDEAIAKIRASGKFPTKLKEQKREKQKPGSQSYDADTNLTTYSHDLRSPVNSKSGRAKLIVKIVVGIILLIVGILIGICL